MDVPPEIAFREMEATGELKRIVLEGIDKLESVHGRLVSCRVMVENATPSRSSGVVHRVRLDLRVPGRTVVVDREPPVDERARDPGTAIREAFEIARRKLKELNDRRRDDTVPAELPPHGRVVRLLGNGEGNRFGFLSALDGRQIYFHESVLSEIAWTDLEIGDEVRYAASRGEEGARATTVAPLPSDPLEGRSPS